MSETVIVGCKLPHGLKITLEGKTVVLNGTKSSVIAGGYGLTHDVDKDFFDKFLSTYKDVPYVKNKMVFAQGKQASAESQAAELQNEVSGFEGINPDKPAPGIERVETKGKK